MSKALEIPKTLLGIITFFADEQRAFETVRDERWPNGVSCPLCGSANVRFMASVRRWNCNGCRKQFSAKTGTIFEESPIGFSKWLPAMWMLTNDKNGISSYELHRALGVTQKTAWFMLHRIRLAMQNGTIILSGSVEADESYIGGKSRNMHWKARQAKGHIGGADGKATVMGMVERGGGKVVTFVINNPTRQTLKDHIMGTVDQLSNLYTDGHKGYDGMSFYYNHFVIDHAREYVRGHVHTNSMENYWSLLKRALKGTYVSVEPFHLFRYLDEQSFRFNERHDDDRGRFVKVLSQVVNKRVTYAQLTGKECPPAVL